MRTKNSIKNSLTAVMANSIAIIAGFIAQTIFIRTLGTEYLGINSLFTNIVSIIGVVELGFGTAIIYNLYKPIKDNNIPVIKTLMNFYKKVYRIIALIIFLIGMIVIPLLPFIVGNITIDININLVFILFIVDIICAYLLSYKRSILYANQKNYFVSIIHIMYLVLLNTLQIIALIITGNYYIYLIIKIIMRLVENIIITLLANKMYPFLKDKNIDELNADIKNNIITKVKAIFLHKTGGWLISGTDNIIISKFLGVITVGLYSNYYMVIHAMETVFSQAITALTPSVGNLLIEKNSQKNYNIFKKIHFINFTLAVIASCILLVCMNNFITMWIGSKYLLPELVLIILTINFYEVIMRCSFISFKEAAGIFYEDRFIPIIQAILNIIISIILTIKLGLVGIFIGTLISSLILWTYSYPKYVYKKLFNGSYLNYIKEIFKDITLFIIIISITYFIANLFSLDNLILQLILNICLSVAIPTLLILIIFSKSDQLKYFINIIKKIMYKEK